MAWKVPSRNRNQRGAVALISRGSHVWRKVFFSNECAHFEQPFSGRCLGTRQHEPVGGRRYLAILWVLPYYCSNGVCVMIMYYTCLLNFPSSATPLLIANSLGGVSAKYCSGLIPMQRLGRLDGAEVASKAENRGNRPDYLRQLDDSCSAPATLRLKVGAQVSGGMSYRLLLWLLLCSLFLGSLAMLTSFFEPTRP